MRGPPPAAAARLREMSGGGPHDARAHGRRARDDLDLHRRSPRVLALTAGRRRGHRFPRRGPLPVRADRRGSRRREDRRSRRDDLPSPLHGQRRAQLLLESASSTVDDHNQGASHMASNGIRDRVAIIGMGCTSFGEHWDKSVDDLLVDAATEALNSTSLPLDAIDAFWLGTLFSGQSGLTLSRPLKIGYKPVSRLENYWATGSEAFRNACYAVASGAYDVAMAIGVEKLKDSGYSGLTGTRASSDGTQAGLTAPATFSLLAPAYCKKYGVDEAQLKEVLTRIAWKNHRNGALNPRAQFRKEVPKETIAC